MATRPCYTFHSSFSYLYYLILSCFHLVLFIYCHPVLFIYFIYICTFLFYHILCAFVYFLYFSCVGLKPILSYPFRVLYFVLSIYCVHVLFMYYFPIPIFMYCPFHILFSCYTFHMKFIYCAFHLILSYTILSYDIPILCFPYTVLFICFS